MEARDVDILFNAIFNPPPVVDAEPRQEFDSPEVLDFRRGKEILGIVRDASGVHEAITYFDASGRSYTAQEVREAGRKAR